MTDAYDCIIYERIRRIAKQPIRSIEYIEGLKDLKFFMNANEEAKQMSEKKTIQNQLAS